MVVRKYMSRQRCMNCTCHSPASKTRNDTGLQCTLILGWRNMSWTGNCSMQQFIPTIHVAIQLSVTTCNKVSQTNNRWFCLKNENNVSGSLCKTSVLWEWGNVVSNKESRCCACVQGMCVCCKCMLDFCKQCTFLFSPKSAKALQYVKRVIFSFVLRSASRFAHGCKWMQCWGNSFIDLFSCRGSSIRTAVSEERQIQTHD